MTCCYAYQAAFSPSLTVHCLCIVYIYKLIDAEGSLPNGSLYITSPVRCQYNPNGQRYASLALICAMPRALSTASQVSVLAPVSTVNDRVARMM